MERIIITLTNADRSFEMDIDVPVSITVQALCEQASQLHPSLPFRGLSIKGQRLPPQATLAHYSVWSGALVEVIS